MLVEHDQSGHDCSATQVKRTSAVRDPHICSISKRRDFSARDYNRLIVLRRCTGAVDNANVRHRDDFDRWIWLAEIG
jgi:hypothetical protein